MVDKLAQGSGRSPGIQEEMSTLVEDGTIPCSSEQQDLHRNLNSLTEVESLWRVLISSLVLAIAVAHQATTCLTAQIGRYCQHEVHFVQASIMQTRIGLRNQDEWAMGN
jgi:hypothetical protein